MFFRTARTLYHFSLDFEKFKRTKWTKLNSRCLLVLQGPDTHKLLQGLITNDLRELTEQKQGEMTFQKISLFTLFLHPKGKIITDAFVFKPRIYKNGKPTYCQQELWLDIDRSAKSALKQHLQKHLWRKKANLIDIDEQAEEGHLPTIYSGYNDNNQTIAAMRGASVQIQGLEKVQENDSYANLIYFDPRGGKFGLRIVSSQEHLELDGHFESIEEDAYHRIAEGLGMPPRTLFENKLPFQFNFDFLNAISLKKGCFIGQQILSRGLLTGIIRRRVFPFTLDQKSKEEVLDEQNCTIGLESGEQIGKILSLKERNGLALINYLPLVEREWPITFVKPFKGTILSPFGMRLKQYVQDMKGKQKMLQDLQ